MAEAVEQLRAQPDRSETLEFDFSMGLLPEYFFGICHILEFNSIAALQNGPSQSSSTPSAKPGRSDTQPGTPAVPPTPDIRT